jgi:hypothetical protein
MMGAKWGIKWTLLTGLTLQLAGIGMLYGWKVREAAGKLLGSCWEAGGRPVARTADGARAGRAHWPSLQRPHGHSRKPLPPRVACALRLRLRRFSFRFRDKVYHPTENHCLFPQDEWSTPSERYKAIIYVTAAQARAGCV